MTDPRPSQAAPAGPRTDTPGGLDAQPASPKVGLLLVLAAVIGVAASVLAVGFVVLEHNLQHLIWTTLPDALGWDAMAWWAVFALLLVGALLTHLARRLPGDGGHEPLHGMGMNLGPKQIASVVLAALASLSFGAVVGPEAPLMAIGTATAVAIATRRDPTQTQVLMLAGAIAAMGMIFGNPLITSVLLLEVAALKGSGGGKAALLQLLPALVALAFGYLVQVGVGSWGGFGASVLEVPGLEPYPRVEWVDLGMTIPVALVTGIVVVAALQLGHAYNRVAFGNKLPAILGAGAIVALCAVAFNGVTGEPINLVLFSGQEAIPEALEITSLGTLAFILVAKAIAYAVSVGGGFRGGLIFPSVFLGVTVGVLGAAMVSDANQSALVAAGIGAGAGAALRLPFTSTLLSVMLCSAAGLTVTSSAIFGAVIGLLVRAVMDLKLSKDTAGDQPVEMDSAAGVAAPTG